MTTASNEDLDAILATALVFDRELRRLYSGERSNGLPDNPHAGLLRIFDRDFPRSIMVARPRVVSHEEDWARQFVFPIPPAGRFTQGARVAVGSIQEFQEIWKIFTEGALTGMDWSGVVAAGGSVLACVQPIPAAFHSSSARMRDYLHKQCYPSSDIDLFLWGLTVTQVCALYFLTEHFNSSYNFSFRCYIKWMIYSNAFAIMSHTTLSVFVRETPFRFTVSQSKLSQSMT